MRELEGEKRERAHEAKKQLTWLILFPKRPIMAIAHKITHFPQAVKVAGDRIWTARGGARCER